MSTEEEQPSEIHNIDPSFEATKTICQDSRSGAELLDLPII